jgi:hypothetical protein
MARECLAIDDADVLNLIMMGSLLILEVCLQDISGRPTGTGECKSVSISTFPKSSRTKPNVLDYLDADSTRDDVVQSRVEWLTPGNPIDFLISRPRANSMHMVTCSSLSFNQCLLFKCSPKFT